MWLADGWKDYQVIDCSKGEKLERWGEYLLVRPDPQVIWDTPKNHVGWHHKNGHYHASSFLRTGTKRINLENRRRHPSSG